MPDPVSSSADAELRVRVERVLAGQYELDCEIGRGGMGIVYLARDQRLKRPVAVKLLPPELAFRPEIRTRFLREAETAAQLSHPHIVPIYTVDEREGLVFFVMGYVDGGNLARRLLDNGPMAPEDVRRVVCEVADALAYAHERNVVHRDIKPDNILLDRATGRAIVTDFGIARAVTEGADSRLTATGMAIGTPAYMSPEQSAGEREVDGRTDLYALGVVSYQMLVGEPPFTASSTPALLVKHLSQRPVPVGERRPGIPTDLASSVMRLLEKNPDDRFATASELADALEKRRVWEPSKAGSHGASPAPLSSAPLPPAPPLANYDAPTAREVQGWSAPQVVEFRRKLAPFIAVNSVILVMSILGIMNLLGVTAVWSVFVAYQYAKLWTDGYDWRDVFKQRRDRMIYDVAAETIDEARALFDKDKRAEVRARDHARRLNSPPGDNSAPWQIASPRSPGSTGGEGGQDAKHAGNSAADRAMAERNEIARLVQSFPKRERARLPDVVASANALVVRVRELSATLDELRRAPASAEPAAIAAEIAALEAQANPLEHTASDARVRRLAQLKRERRTVLDAEQRLSRNGARLDSCVTALQNMRLDLVRLKTGAESHERVTLLAERAMSLAHDVDGMVSANDLGSRDRFRP